MLQTHVGVPHGEVQKATVDGQGLAAHSGERRSTTNWDPLSETVQYGVGSSAEPNSHLRTNSDDGYQGLGEPQEAMEPGPYASKEAAPPPGIVMPAPPSSSDDAVVPARPICATERLVRLISKHMSSQGLSFADAKVRAFAEADAQARASEKREKREALEARKGGGKRNCWELG